jgi:hypothetical protein
MITNGAVDRAVHGWIADECGKSTVKNSLAILVRVMEQALRDGIIERNPPVSPDGSESICAPKMSSTTRARSRYRTDQL